AGRGGHRDPRHRHRPHHPGLRPPAPAAPGPTARDTMMDETKIEIREVYKVFGPREGGPQEARAVELLRQGADKAGVQAQTGCNVGLAGVSAKLAAGRISCIMGLSG